MGLTAKGGLFSESFSLWLQSPKKKVQITILSTCYLKERCSGSWFGTFLLDIEAKVKNFLRLSHPETETVNVWLPSPFLTKYVVYEWPLFDIQELPRGHLLAYPIDVAVNLHDNFPIGTIHILRKHLWVGGFHKKAIFALLLEHNTFRLTVGWRGLGNEIFCLLLVMCIHMLS